MANQSYRDLEVWQKSMKVVTTIYEITEQFPKSEVYSLTNQISRAAVSIPSNIAEGRSRYGTKEFIRFLFIARGSVSELETQLLISQNLSYISEEQLVPLMDNVGEIGRMLSGLIAKLEPKVISA